MILDYTILAEASPLLLTKVVKRFIREGWQPLGSVGFTPQENGMYLQGMVKSPPGEEDLAKWVKRRLDWQQTPAGALIETMGDTIDEADDDSDPSAG